MEYSGPNADFSGLVRKTGSAAASPDSPCSCADGPAARKSVDLPQSV
jgi:hypothetical protein